MKLDCDVVLDLIPLVKDKVASLKSEELVLDHINSCESCKLEYDTFDNIHIDEANLDDKKIIKKIKRGIYISEIALIIIGPALGIALTNLSSIYYNFLVIPIVGAVSVIRLKRKFYIAPLALFIASFFIRFIYLSNYYELYKYKNIIDSLVHSLILTILILSGALVTILLRFAFKKEEKL